MKQYAIGMDFGTLSARAVLVRLSDGTPLPETCVYVYPSGNETQIGGKPVEKNQSLQDPADYRQALVHCLRGVVEANGIDPEEVAAIGMDFTTSTFFPVDEEGIPLCQREEFATDHHAYVKMWKHHGGEPYVRQAEAAAAETGDDLLSYSGGKMSCELMLPKMIETLQQSPAVYEATARFLNTGDYAAELLTGKFCHSTAFACLKEYRKPNGQYPSRDYFKAIDPRLESLVGTKLSDRFTRVCSPVGTLCTEWSEITHLPTDVVVAAPIADAHGAFSAAGVEDGLLLLALGTSACACLISESRKPVPGVMSWGVDVTFPDMTTYDAGISAMGDLFAWFVDNCVPASYERAAAEKGMNIHGYLLSLAEKQEPGDHGLLALDWWNGNRTVICDNRLSGLLIGMTLATRPEDIYRALLESCAFALRRISELYADAEIAVKRIVATGGISRKNPLMMQILADVFGREIGVLSSEESTAIGSAIHGAVACGYYSSIQEASAQMRLPLAKTYSPDPKHVKAYEAMYREYLRLYDSFGWDPNSVMKAIYRDR
ncbi:MAG: ribulokinase [Clostridia bacterium]|nr:ribulokinase [Clostridia bacterium]